MSLGKKDIIKNISSKAQISLSDSSFLLNNFIDLIKSNKDRYIKIHSFGTFSIVATPQRIGRNPKTKELFKINARKKLKFNPSNKIRNILN